MPQSIDDYIAFLDYPRDGGSIGSFSLRFTIIKRTSRRRAIADLKEALDTPGAIVAYMSHTSLGDKGALGLDPELKKRPVLKNAALVKLLEGATANVAILAGCATSVSVKKLKNDIVAITTDSGRDGVTNSASWARAIAAFLLALVGYDFDAKTGAVNARSSVASIQEAVAAANPFFPGGDSFVLASGDGTMILP